MRKLEKVMAPLWGVIAVLTVCACTPEELSLVERAIGADIGTVEEVNMACEAMFGPESAVYGGTCWQAGANIVADNSSQQPHYQHFDDCHAAVDYVFAGRWDKERAHRVVQRESTNDPSAVSPTGARGCTQITSGIRQHFLDGPWDDPYWNVLAMRRIVDHQDWGWCHWDIVNFCLKGGEF